MKAFTITQKQRLTELDAGQEILEKNFSGLTEREAAFKSLEKELISKNKKRLDNLNNISRRPILRRLETLLVDKLTEQGFVEVVTPTTMSSGMLAKMGITSEHPLWQQIYWLEGKNCLRPMLAPNLYYLLGRFTKLWPKPIKIFEIGSCFRKESKGAKHLSEFTMLNLVELGVTGSPENRLSQLAGEIMNILEVEYTLETESSEVYGDTIDVMVKGIEVASGATGPHRLDENWDIVDNWVGLGFGLERLGLVMDDFNSIRRVGRSLMYLDGARLNL